MALGFSGQLRHSLSLLPLTLCRQPHHHPRHRGHGDRFPGLPGCHQREQVPPAECECITVFGINELLFIVCWHFSSFIQFFIVLLIILLAELILLILFFVYTDKVRLQNASSHPHSQAADECAFISHDPSLWFCVHRWAKMPGRTWKKGWCCTTRTTTPAWGMLGTQYRQRWADALKETL